MVVREWLFKNERERKREREREREKEKERERGGESDIKCERGWGSSLV
jgi:hypothetical protein